MFGFKSNLSTEERALVQIERCLVRPLRFSVIGLIYCLFLIGCDAKNWPGFCCATPVPDSRILIELSSPMTYEELYPFFVKAASEGGFNHFFGRTGVPSIEQLFSEYREGSLYLTSVRWTEQPNHKAVFVPTLVFSLNSNSREEPDQTKRVASSVILMLQKDSTESITEAEWDLFFRYYREILPKVFEDKIVRSSITRHPAIFTDSKLLLEIHELTDYEIPGRYLEKALSERRSEIGEGVTQ